MPQLRASDDLALDVAGGSARYIEGMAMNKWISVAVCLLLGAAWFATGMAYERWWMFMNAGTSVIAALNVIVFLRDKS